ncbi:ABC transporter substrate-binding protein [Spongisporangium articulatum]|uniref:ABC transporter substrate-binding protein n=1 Tax=Spongisporangium articulatum TaxID=3362603 RepID=A0ABW8APK9_9ACTN
MRILLVVATLLLAGCTSGSGEDERLTVGGGPSSESQILQALYAKLLSRAGFQVEAGSRGDRETYLRLLREGTLDVVPEYAATLTEYLNHELNGDRAATASTHDVGQTVAALRELADDRGLGVLDPAEAASQNGFAVSKALADEHDLTTLSDLAALQRPVTLAASAQCARRPLCRPGLERVYGLSFAALLPTGYGSAATKQAVVSGKADLALVGTTDGAVAGFGLVLLADDRGLQPADNLVPVVNERSAGGEKVAAALRPLAGVLTTERLAALNAQVDGGRRDPEDVAQDFLEAADLL